MNIVYKLENENNKFNNIKDFFSFLRKFNIDRVKYKDYNYYNIPLAFDIETTSIGGNTVRNVGQEKFAFMYLWTLSFCGYIFYGRTWEEFKELCFEMVNSFNISLENRIIVYVHNLAYEFQFFRKYFSWNSIFSLDKRKPVKALTIDGIEFRCSYILSGYNLELLGKSLTRYKVNKAVGDLDYTKIRHFKTPLNEIELNYAIKDVMVVSSYIMESIENNENNISKIPLTKTGYVRKYCRENCLYENRNHRIGVRKFSRYRKLMKELTMTPELYTLAKNAFMGGFTHANALTVNEVIRDVWSFDESSAYPYVMVSEQFPMSKPYKYEIKSKEDFYEKINEFCCLFYIRFKNIKSKYLFESYIPISHALSYKDAEENNGRVVKAKEIIIAVTELDFFIINSMYNFEDFEIGTFYYFYKNFLPRDLVLSILKLYKDKTELKGVGGKEVEYALSKEQINSAYGMMVTDICREEIEYKNGEWNSSKPNLEKSIKKYNNSIKRFLSYIWGLYVPAYARLNLFTGILEFKEDYIYSDTDSLKVVNIEKHKDYFIKYNNLVKNKLEYAMKQQQIDIEMTRPKTINGIVKQLGVWENEGCYTRFKTLGAKRYMYEKDGAINITVSGLNKKKTVPYLLKTYEDVFKAFNNNLYIPRDYTGKMLHTYIDEEQTKEIEDYLGNKEIITSKSSVHLEPTDYSLDLSIKYLEYLIGIKEMRR